MVHNGDIVSVVRQHPLSNWQSQDGHRGRSILKIKIRYKDTHYFADTQIILPFYLFL